MHTGSKQKKSKTEILRILEEIVVKHHRQRRTNWTLQQIKDYLHDLSDDADVNNRITKSTKEFGSCRSLIFCNPYLPFRIKNTCIWQSPWIYFSGVVKNWALPTSMQHTLESFHAKGCRAILGIIMQEVRMYKVRSWSILARVGVPTLENIIHYFRLDWMLKIVNMPPNCNPQKFWMFGYPLSAQ